MSATAKFYHSIAGCISGLFGASAPLAIGLIVISQGINPIDAHARRTVSHVFVEFSKGFIPFIADSYTFPAVVFILLVIGAIAPIFHGSPAMILAGWILVGAAVAMATARSAQASARLNVARLQVSRCARVFFAAFTDAYPTGRLNVAIAADDGETAKNMAGEVLEFHNAGFLNFLAGFKISRKPRPATNVTFGVSPYPALTTMPA